MRPLPPELLRSFVAVAQSGSFTAASERVNLSQSTVSQHIRRLEELLDRPLFERDTRNVHLSQHGDALFRYAVRILELMDEAVTSVCGPPLSGKVRLAMSEDFASAHLTAALASFVQRNPDVELAISTGLSGDLFDALDEAVLPLAMHPEPSVSRRRVLESLEAVGRPYRIAVVSSSIAVLRAAASAGLGVSAFAGYVIPAGLARLEAGLPELGELEYVIDRPAAASRSTLALEATLITAAAEL